VTSPPVHRFGRPPTDPAVAHKTLCEHWARAETTALDVFKAAAAAGTEVFAAGATYGFPPKHHPDMGHKVRSGFAPLLEHTGQTSVHAALTYRRSLDGWIDRLADGCIPFLRAYQAELPVLQGPLSFCMVRVELDIPHKATVYVNGVRVDVCPLGFLEKARHLQPAIASFGSKTIPVSAHSVQEAVALWELSRD
jgi:hypothetical protein